jgi:hypothetical protein
MKQVSLGLNLSTKKTRKREFLEQMIKVVPWDVLAGVVEPHWPKSKTGRPPGEQDRCRSSSRLVGIDGRASEC